MAIAPIGALNAAVEHASAILATDPVGAQRAAEAILAQQPNDPRALLVLASARRRQGDATRALKILTSLATAYPRAAHTRYELGRTFEALDQPEKAIAALRQAVAVKPDLAEAWRALGDLLFAQGDNAAADAAFSAYEQAQIQDPTLAPAAADLYGGRLDEAERRLHDLVRARPDDAAVYRLLAETMSRMGRHEGAEMLLAHALRLKPDHEGAQFSYAYALFHQQKGVEAVDALRPLIAKYPSEPAYLNLLAACLILLGDFEEALRINEGLVARYPNQPKIWLNDGHALRTVGRRDEAIAAYKRCIALAPGLGEAYWSLANLKVATLTPAEEAAMIAELARGDRSADDRIHLHFALGKALEDRGDFARAFENYSQGASIRRAAIPYNAEETTALAHRSMARFTRDLFDAASGGCQANDPIFIVGLPRSGSTLVEQILASHSSVEGTMELAEIGLIAKGLKGSLMGASLGDASLSQYPDTIVDLSPAQLTALGERFIERTRVHRPLGRPYFTDKMPSNFQHIGLIQLILPNAKIIDVRRHPLGSCFSAFKQHFAQGQNFSYDLEDLGKYYRDYLDLTRHFDSILPAKIYRTIYENLVEDTETEVRRLLDYCGLPFEENCLHFHRNDRAVRTVSSEQVRRPIFRDGVEQWRNFESYLGPLKTALGDALQSWRGND
jgi:tetratricopeptide (TPR) repeat protein